MNDKDPDRVHARLSALELLMTWLLAKMVLSSANPMLEMRTISNDINELLDDDIRSSRVSPETGIEIQNEVDDMIKFALICAGLDQT